MGFVDLGVPLLQPRFWSLGFRVLGFRDYLNILTLFCRVPINPISGLIISTCDKQGLGRSR